jgi:hypothetical protein
MGNLLPLAPMRYHGIGEVLSAVPNREKRQTGTVVPVENP